LDDRAAVIAGNDDIHLIIRHGIRQYDICSAPGIVHGTHGGGGDDRGALLSLAFVVAAVGVDLVLVITLFAVAWLGIAVTTDRDLAVLGAAVFVRVITIITLLARVDNAITTKQNCSDYLAALGFKGAISGTGGAAGKACVTLFPCLLDEVAAGRCGDGGKGKDGRGGDHIPGFPMLLIGAVAMGRIGV